MSEQHPTAGAQPQAPEPQGSSPYAPPEQVPLVVPPASWVAPGTPPYARGAAEAPGGHAVPPEAFATPSTSSGTIAPLPGQPPTYPGQPYAGPTYPYPARTPDPRPKAFAIVALTLAILGAVGAFIPFAAWLAWAPLLAAFILGLVALVSKKQGGKGMSIAAIAVSVVGFLISVVMSVVLVGLMGYGSWMDAGGFSGSGTVDDGLGDGASVPDAKALVITDKGFGQASDGTWWYAFELRNPNESAVFDGAEITVDAVAADGTILDTQTEYLTVLPGKSGDAGYFENIDDQTVAKIDVHVPPASDATALPSTHPGGFQLADVQATSVTDGPVVRGTVISSFDRDQSSVLVSAIVRDANGKIVAGEYDVIDRVPAGGRARFTVHFYDDLPPGATVEVYPSL